MGFSRFFIDRPIFAVVIATVITILGAICYTVLPIAQYPEVVPPTVQVTATYPGASAETVAETVAAPIEQEINGVDGMLYQSSQSTGDGRLVITVTFRQGTNLDTAQTLVQNRVAIAIPRLPEEVQRLGVVTKKTAPDILLAINLISPDHSLDDAYISNYAVTRIRDELLRVEGVGDAELFGSGDLKSRDLNMRVWLDPRRAAALGLTAGDIVSALRSQNVQVAAGTLGQPPSEGDAFQLNVQTQGQFTDPAQFANVVIRTDPDGRQVHVSDIANVRFGAEDYDLSAYLGTQKSVVIRVVQLPGSNALAAAEGTKAVMERLSKRFPPGLTYKIAYGPTEFIQRSIEGREDAVRGRAARHAGRYRLPAKVARGDHPGARYSGLADRHRDRARGVALDEAILHFGGAALRIFHSHPFSAGGDPPLTCSSWRQTTSGRSTGWPLSPTKDACRRRR